MLKVVIKNIGSDDEKNKNFFETESECLNWINEIGFDINEKKISESDAIGLGFNLSDLRKESETDGSGNSVDYYFIPPTQEYFITNADAEIKEKNELSESIEAVALCNYLKSYIRNVNKKKLANGVWTSTTFQSFLTSTLISQAERALNQASLGTYKSLVLNATAFYTQEEINEIINKVVEHETKWNTIINGG